MNRMQFEEGIRFFLDPATLELEKDIVLVLYDSGKVVPQIMASQTYHKLYRDTQEDLAWLNTLKAMDEIGVDAFEKMQNLQKKLRVVTGDNKGAFLNELQFICPVTRETLTHGNIEDAVILLQIFLHEAKLQGFTSDEIDELLDSDSGFMPQAAEAYNQVKAGERMLTPNQMNVLNKFGIDLSAPLPLNHESDYDEELDAAIALSLCDQNDLLNSYGKKHQIKDDYQFALALNFEMNGGHALSLDNNEEQKSDEQEKKRRKF